MINSAYLDWFAKPLGGISTISELTVTGEQPKVGRLQLLIVKLPIRSRDLVVAASRIDQLLQVGRFRHFIPGVSHREGAA